MSLLWWTGILVAGVVAACFARWATCKYIRRMAALDKILIEVGQGLGDLLEFRARLQALELESLELEDRIRDNTVNRGPANQLDVAEVLEERSAGR